MLAVVAADAQLIVTYDSRIDKRPTASAVDLAVKDVLRNPDYQPWMLNHSTPALIDIQSKMAVRITGTVDQARADLQRLITDQPISPERLLLRKLAAQFIAADKLDREDLAAIAEIFPEHVGGRAYRSNDIVRIDGELAIVREDSDGNKPVTISPVRPGSLIITNVPNPGRP